MGNNAVRLKSLLFFFALFSLQFICVTGFSLEQTGCFEISPWKVGQFAEYRIVSLENEGMDNRYKIRITAKETLGGIDYFWINLDIYESGTRQISFKGLVKPFYSIDFSRNPGLFISEGMIFLFRNAKQLFVTLSDTPAYEIDPNIFVNQPDILQGTFYKNIPDEKNTVDFSKLMVSPKEEKITTPAGNFTCYRFSVSTDEADEFTDEGFDLWRSSKVPFLGIVKLEFSKTKYQKKWKYQYEKLTTGTDNWLLRFLRRFLNKQVFSIERSDMHTIRLLKYGEGN
ncbi:MAG: hypothetical protein V1739_06175 [Candidatus Omnitrophota bacterium]